MMSDSARTRSPSPNLARGPRPSPPGGARRSLAAPATPANLFAALRQPNGRRHWERFVHFCTPVLLAWASRLGLQEQDAADLVQDVYVVLIQKLPGLRDDGGGRFHSWMRTVLLNKWRDHCKHLHAVRLGAPLREPPGPDTTRAVDESDYRDHLVRRARQITEADFRPATWRACWEHAVPGRPAAEVAAELGVSEATVYAATFRVLSRLREEPAGPRA
jgi:RNA polymerase sigma-70 factor (ECF subfamily)